MHAAVRPYFTGGIALVGASVIAVSPIAPPLPDIHLPNPAQVAKEVELAAFVNPITTLVDVIQTSINNLSTTGGQVLADPFPVLQQLGVNQLGFANTLGTAAQGLANAIASLDTARVTANRVRPSHSGRRCRRGKHLQQCPDHRGAGSRNTLASRPRDPQPDGAEPLERDQLSWRGRSPPRGPRSQCPQTRCRAQLSQFGASAQAVVDAVQAGDGVTALSALLNGPAEITGAFLNGVPSQGFPGILSPSAGLANVLAVQIPQQIAQALGALAPTATLAAVKAPSALPSVAPKMVTLPTPAKVNVPAVGSGPIAKLLAPVHTKTTTTTADSTAVTTADSTAATTASSAGSLKTKGDGNKVAPGAVGAKGTKAGGGLAKAVSKIGAGHKSKSGATSNNRTGVTQG